MIKQELKEVHSQSGKFDNKRKYAKHQISASKEAQKERLRRIKQKSLESGVEPPIKRHNERMVLNSHSDVVEDSLVTILDFWDSNKDLLQLATDSLSYYHLEKFVCLLVTMKDVTTVSSFISTLQLYMSEYTGKSAAGLVVESLHKILGFTFKGEALDSQSDFTIDAMKELMSHFSVVKHSALSNKLLELCSMLITVGLCKSQDLEWSWNGFQVFKPEALRRQVKATDFIESLMEIFVLFWERGSRCFSGEGPMAFFTESQNAEYDSEYTEIMSRYPLIEAGQIARIDMDEHEYDRRLTEITDMTMKYLGCVSGAERNFYAFRLEKLKKLRTALILAQRANVRRRPFGVLLFGKSSVGKSAMSNALMRYILACNDFDHDPTSIVTLNEFDKFQSEYRSRHSGVIFDDLANGKKDTTEGNPLMKVIQFINNIPMAALNPNVELKGNVMIQPDVVLATTNVKGLQASEYSEEPIAVLRRFDAIITVTVKPEFRKRNSEMLDPAKAATVSHKTIPDFNLFTVEYAFDKEKRTIGYAPYVHNGVELKEVELPILLDFLKTLSAEHFAAQRSYVGQQDKLADFTLCEHKNLPESCPHCSTLESHVEVGDLFPVEQFHRFSRFGAATISNMMPNVFEWRIAKLFITLLYRNQLKNTLFYLAYFHFMCFCVHVVSFGFNSLASAFLSWVLMYAFVSYFILMCQVQRYMREIDVSRSVSVTLARFRTNLTRKKVFVGAGAFAALYIAYRMYSQWRATSSQTKYATFDLAKEKESEKELRFHRPLNDENIPTVGVVRTMTTEQLVNLVSRNLAYIRIFDTKTKFQTVNAFPVCSNVWLLPNHCVPSVDSRLEILSDGLPHGKIESRISPEVCHKIPGTDLALMYLPNVPNSKDLIDCFPDELYKRRCVGHLLYNNGSDIKRFLPTWCSFDRRSTKLGGTFECYSYTLKEDTFNGLCNAAMIVEGALPFIGGLHLGGRGKFGVAGVITRHQLRSAIEELYCKIPGIITHSAIDMPTSQMGIEYGPLSSPHPDSCVHTVVDGVMRVHGEHTLPRAHFSSSVRTTAISEDVEEIMGLERIHGPPYKMSSPVHWERDIDGRTHPASNFDPRIVNLAYCDYRDSVLDFLKEVPDVKNSLGVLSNDAVLAGLDGVSGINAMNFNSAKGFPESGSKKTVSDFSDRHVEGISCPRDVDQKYWDEVARMESELLAGRRINVVFKGALKDEPTKLDKQKVRMFSGSNMAFTMLGRKYFLTIAKLMQDFPLQFECAVGIVERSPEWTTFVEHVQQHGTDRIVAGDYASFDLRMPAQFTLAAFRVLIDIAEWAGYDSDDIKIMRGIATEICYPIYDYNGVLVETNGSNPSGHFMTVDINSIGNSMYLRYGYYKIYDGSWRLPRFNKAVALITLGDDNAMGVKKGYDKFNHTALVKVFAECGITYTMADKEAESRPFIDMSEFSFLKRGAVFDEELGLYRAPIELNSIKKMLHARMDSKFLTVRESSADALNNALTEFFEYGREEYSKRLPQITQIAHKHNLHGMVDLVSYDVRLERFREKYGLAQSR